MMNTFSDKPLKDIDFRTLPAVLTKHELLRMTGKKDEALKLSINRWVKRGVLKKAGQRSGMYYNLVADPQWENHILSAVEKKFPSAILAGPSVLHAHGLQTQIPGYFYVAVLSQRTLPQMEKVQWMPRSRKWFAEFVPPDNLYGMRSLSPEQALRDGLKHQHQANAWVPDMDDIDVDDIEGVDLQELEKQSSVSRKRSF